MVEALPPPVMLGDVTTCCRDTRRLGGGTSETYLLGWTHGPLLPGAFSVEEIVAFAEWVEAVYQRGTIAR